MSSKGFVKIDRSLQDNWIWQDKPFSKGQAWIDLIMIANHKDIKKMVNGNLVVYKRGTVNQSQLSLAEKWGWERKTVSRFLSVLERDQMVSVEGTTKGTTITIVNYGKYQSRGATKCPTERTTEGTTERTTERTQTRMIKNEEEGEEDACASSRPNPKPDPHATDIPGIIAYMKSKGYE